jgi:hypothetical protein
MAVATKTGLPESRPSTPEPGGRRGKGMAVPAGG